MTVKEIEALSGLTRANIRFYESQGLLSPAREENGYRDYSENDLETLRRIKLLRSLGVSLEEIGEAQRGERPLMEILGDRMEALSGEQRSLERAKEVCREMRADHVRYDTLNARKYLDNMERDGSPTQESAVAADVAPRTFVPWRRFFARSLDYSLCSFLWSTLLALGFHVNMMLERSAAGQLADAFAAFALMLFAEPLLLRLFKTTPGKWLMGIRVTDNEGGRLSYRDGLARTAGALCWGMGFDIPGFSLYRKYKSYKTYADERPLPWEYDSELTVKDEKSWRPFALAGAYAGIFCLSVLVLLQSRMPVNRGDLTAAEFCENYNTYQTFYGYDDDWRLNDRGDWVDADPFSYSVSIDGDGVRPNFSFTEENGALTGVTLTEEHHAAENDEQDFVRLYRTEMALAIYSFTLAQRGVGLWQGEAREAVEQISNRPFEDMELSAYGVKLSVAYDFKGYQVADFGGDASLVPSGKGERSFSFTFTMTRED